MESGVYIYIYIDLYICVYRYVQFRYVPGEGMTYVNHKEWEDRKGKELEDCWNMLFQGRIRSRKNELRLLYAGFQWDSNLSSHALHQLMSSSGYSQPISMLCYDKPFPICM